MLQRPYLESEIQYLQQENLSLRDRLRKCSQIESYADILIQNNKKYQEDVKSLQVENTRLRGKVDDILEQTILIKEAHEKEVTQIRRGFQGDIEKLIRELKEILKDKEQMQNGNKKIIEELSLRCRKDLENKKRQYDQLQVETTRKINKLTESLKGKQRVIQQITWECNQKQRQLLDQIQKLSNQLAICIKQKQAFLTEIQLLGDEKKNLAKKNKELGVQNQQISLKILKNDQQKNQLMLQLKNKNLQLTKSNEQLELHLKTQQKVINQQNRKIVHLNKQCDDICKSKNDIQGNLRKTTRSFQQLKTEHAQIVAKLQSISKITEVEIKKQVQEINKFTQDNKRLQRQNLELSQENKSKFSQIQDLIRAIQKLERKMADLNAKITDLDDLNNKKTLQMNNLQQNLQQIVLERKSLSQKLTLYSNHNSTLEQMLQKQKRKNIHLETSRFQIQTIAMGALTKPQQICKQYQKEIQKIVQQFLAQKRETQICHQQELLHYKSLYEEALKEKDDYFHHKILYLERQMQSLKIVR